MITGGKAGLQQRAVKTNGWTKARRVVFLQELSVTCNVAHAARVVGKSAGTAYRLRDRDEQFALLWAKAIEAGAERLKERLLAYSLGQVPNDDNPAAVDASERVETAPFDAVVAMGTLRTLAAVSRRGGRAANKPDYATDEEVNALLMERLQALARKVAREQAATDGQATGGQVAEGQASEGQATGEERHD